jgi:hypothetical protein
MLRYLTDAPPRARVTAATNKVEAFNGFSDWVRFGQHGTVAANDPVEQEKDVRYTSLLANLVILHNTLDITDVVRELQAEGRPVDPLDLAQVSPCPDRAHQAVRRVLHPRTRHQPRRLRRPPGRRLRRARRRREGGSGMTDRPAGPIPGHPRHPLAPVAADERA